MPSAWLSLPVLAAPVLVAGARQGQLRRTGADAVEADSRQPLEAGAGERLLCRLEPPAVGGGDRILEVWEQPGNVRLAEFQDTGSFESRVHCKGEAPECQIADPNTATDISACAACACELDSARDTSESEHAIVEAVLPHCKAAQGGSADPADVLLLGLGGGVVHTTLHQSCPDGLRLRSAEIDPRFAAIASQYFGLPLAEGSSEVVVGDALAVVKQELQAKENSSAVLAQGAEDPSRSSQLGAAGWDVVVIDCFVGKGRTPESCRSVELIQDIKKILKPQGTVVHHLWHTSPQDERVAPEFQAALGEYRKSFGEEQVKVFPIFRENPDLRLDDIVVAKM